MSAGDTSCPAHLMEQVLEPGMAWQAVGLTSVDHRRSLWPAEAAAVAGAVEKRQREFAAGRQAARVALAQVCGYSGAIPVAPDRSPCWPDGVAGSITHDEFHALAVVARQAVWRSLGVDMESPQRFHAGLEPHLCRLEEVRLWLECVAPTERQRRLACLFCIKEAVYKAQYPVARAWLDFVDLAVSLPDVSGGAFSAELQRSAGPFAAGHRFVGRCAWSPQRCLALIGLAADA